MISVWVKQIDWALFFLREIQKDFCLLVSFFELETMQRGEMWSTSNARVPVLGTLGSG